MNEENQYYSINQLDDSTYLVWDKTKRIPSPHYYSTFSGASKKCRQIIMKTK